MLRPDPPLGNQSAQGSALWAGRDLCMSPGSMAHWPRKLLHTQWPLKKGFLCELFKSTLFNFQLSVEWLNFLLCYLFDFVLLWSKNLIPVISILSYLLRFAFFFIYCCFSPGGCSNCAWNECIFCCRWVEYSVIVSWSWNGLCILPDILSSCSSSGFNCQLPPHPPPLLSL